MYKYIIQELSKNVCHIYNNDNEYLGTVWIDDTNAWNVVYNDGVNYLPINQALNEMGYPCQVPYFTSRILDKGQIFEFYTDLGVYHKENDIIKVWTGESHLNKNIYGKARITEVPNKPTGLYKAMIVG